MRAAWTRYRRVLGTVAPDALAAALALLVLILLWLPAWRSIAAPLIVALAGMEWWRLGRIGSHRHRVARAVIVTALVLATWFAGPETWWFAVALLSPVALVLVEATLDRMTTEDVTAWRLPGVPPSTVSALERTILALTALLALVGIGLPALWFAVAALVALAAAGVATVRRLRAARGHRVRRAVAAALADYAPRYAILFSGEAEAAYQISMWLPYLERTQEPYVLVIREVAFASTALTLTRSPVVFVDSVESLESLLVDSIGAVFYVNNAIKNADGIRFQGPTHVHLGHGDSDKPASYHKATAMFDEIFVAGQAGVDRFARHDVLVPAEKFRIVGRPQVEAIERAGPSGAGAPVVLYAPTWQGSLADMGFGSLRLGRQIVRELIGLGAAVIFRPHPYSYRDAQSRVLIEQIDEIVAAAGPAHLPSSEAAKLGIIESFNRSDALVTDVSSVASDYLRSGKPLAITDTGVVDGALVDAFPLARAAYVVGPGRDFTQAFRHLLTDDPLAAERERLRAYYLGDLPDDDYAGTFVDAVHRAIERGTRAPDLS